MESPPETDARWSSSHWITCQYCRAIFDLFVAVWCAHTDFKRSKICPACRMCLCGHASYRNPRLWKDAPRAFKKFGIDELFVLYV